jgi:multidrug transporter EmrE-like cation transporter
MDTLTLYLIVIVISAVISILLTKQYNISFNFNLVIAIIILNIIIIYGYFKILGNNNNTGSLYAITKIIALIGVAVGSYFFFGESFGTKKIWGIIFAVIAVYLLA